MPVHSQPVRGGPRCPLLLATIAYAGGILLAQHCWRPRLWWLAASVTLLAGATAFAVRAARTRWRGRVALGCALACAMALGALRHDAQWASAPDRSGWESLTGGDKFILTGHVVRDGLLRGSGPSRRQSVDVRLESAEPLGDSERGTERPAERMIESSGDRAIGRSAHPANTRSRSKNANTRSRRRTPRVRRPLDPCAVNTAWPAELLAASGVTGCDQKVRVSEDQRIRRAVARSAHGDGTVRGNESAKAKISFPTDISASSAVPVPQGIVRISIYGRSDNAHGAGETQGPSTAPLRGSARDDNEPDDVDGHQTERQQTEGQRTHVQQASAGIPAAGAIPSSASISTSTALPTVFTYGQRLRFVVALRPPRNFGNPGSLDYAGYLRGQDIYALGTVRADRIELLDGSGGSHWGLWRSRIRRSVIARVHSLWPPEQAGLLDAMLIGERSFIGRETSAAFQRTGIYHILVVSGMNVGILAFVVFWTLRRLRCGEVLATIVTILLSCGYAYVAESGAPIVRSVVMLAIFLCTRLLYRERALLNAVGAAALALMVVDPRAVTDSSFQLTFLSVLSICGIAVPLIERTSQPYRIALRWLSSTDYDMSLAPRLAQFRIDLRMLADRLARLLPRLPKPLFRIAGRRWRKGAVQSTITILLRLLASAYELLVVSFTTQIALALPMAWYFHRATVTGLPANLIAVPLTGVLMPTSVAALFLSYVWMPLAQIPARFASWAVAGITWTVEVLGGVTVADLRLAKPELWTAIAAGVAFVSALLLARRRKLLAFAGLAALCLSAVCISAAPRHSGVERGKLEITAIDVGQAESFLVITPDGRKLLVDAAGSLGPWQSEFDFGEDVIAPYLWSRGITRLDAVAVTHAHSDHYGGMSSILKIFRPREIWVGLNPPDRGFDDLVRQAEKAGVQILNRSAGDAFSFGSAQVRVLAPALASHPGARPTNNDSLVLWLGYGGTSALLEADAESSSERQMLGSGLESDLLKVAHNGSKTSSTPEFLAQVQPRYAVISVGARNSFGHPRPEVLERLAAMHARTYRTDLLGAVTFLLDGQKVAVRLPMMEDR